METKRVFWFKKQLRTRLRFTCLHSFISPSLCSLCVFTAILLAFFFFFGAALGTQTIFHMSNSPLKLNWRNSTATSDKPVVHHLAVGKLYINKTWLFDWFDLLWHQLESQRCDTSAAPRSKLVFRCQSAEPLSHRSVAVGKTKPAARYERTINNRRSASVWSPTLVSAESPRGTGGVVVVGVPFMCVCWGGRLSLSASCLTNCVFNTTSAGSCTRVTPNARNLSQETPNSGSNLLHGRRKVSTHLSQQNIGKTTPLHLKVVLSPWGLCV